MKLYSYEHCPYCVKARMIFGFKKVDFEHVILLNDDEETPISMIGKKMLPVLEFDDGQFMAESLDIIDFVDNKFGEARVQASKGDERLTQFLQDMRQYHYALAMPRWVKMDLPEFATQGAVDYFTRKKEKSIGPFPEALASTEKFVAMANEHLPKLTELMSQGPYFWGEDLSLDDFHVFASLRVLTTTLGVQYPEKIKNYMDRISEESGVALHGGIQ